MAAMAAMVLLGGVVAVARLEPVRAAAAAAPTPGITEFPVAPNSGPNGITSRSADGTLWFTEQYGNAVGSISTAGVPGVAFTLPTANAGAASITTGADDTLWLTEQQVGQIAHVDPGPPGGAIEEIPLPDMSAGPTDITLGPDGNLWFTEQYANQIGRVTPGVVGGDLVEFALPTASAAPYGIVAGPDGNLWFTERSANQIGRITPTGSFDEFPLVTAAAPTGIAAGPDGRLWFTEQITNAIGTIGTDGTLGPEFPMPDTAQHQLNDITPGPDGAMWFTDTNLIIGRVDTGGVVTEYFPPTPGSRPVEITAGSDGALWFTEQNANQIGRIAVDAVPAPAVSGLTPRTVTPNQQSTVVITGSQLSGATDVRFGTTAAVSFTVDNGSQITAIAPPLAPGRYDVTVTTPGGTTLVGADTNIVALAPLSITSVIPAEGDPAGGDPVTITGTGFTAATSVIFGDAEAVLTAPGASRSVVDSDTQITAIAPPHDEGTVSVMVRTGFGDTVTLPDSYTYRKRPFVFFMSPAAAPADGGGAVIINGNRFTGATSVNFGDVSVPCGGACQVLSDAQIAVAVPAHALGSVTVTVTTPVGTSIPGFPIGSATTFAFYGEGKFRPTDACDQADGKCTSDVMANLPDGTVLSVGANGSDPAVKVYDPSTGRWTRVDSCAGCFGEFYMGMTLTVLPPGPPEVCGVRCGKVLLAGGAAFGSSYTALYDPASKTWSDLPAMRCSRAGHTATLLPNGKVLVAGGISEEEGTNCEDGALLATSSAELFDPVSGTWSDAGSMAHPRSYETATLLPTGKVLVVGGICGQCMFAFNAQPTVELYNPASNRFTEVSPMGQARYLQTATLLPDGRILVAGGQLQEAVGQPHPYSNVVEIYDPTQDSWTQIDPMAFGRAGHAAVLLPNGRVLVVGGDQNDQYTDYGYGPDGPAFGFNGSHGNQTSIGEVFDPATGKWTPAPPALRLGRNPSALPYRNVEAVLLPDGPASLCGDRCGRVLVARGWDSNDELGRTPWSVLYDPVAGVAPVSGPPIPDARPIPDAPPIQPDTLASPLGASAAPAPAAGARTDEARQGAAGGRIPRTGADLAGELALAEVAVGLGLVFWGLGFAHGASAWRPRRAWRRAGRAGA